MKQKKIKSIIDGISNVISLSAIAKAYFGKDKSWLYHKLNEDTVNGVKYSFTSEELQTLINALTHISKRITLTTKCLKELKQRQERSRGRYLTEINPFNNTLFKTWFDFAYRDGETIVEPFAGNKDIVRHVNEIYPLRSIKWDCYDIDPIKDNDYKVTRRDTINNFPKRYNITITNPPYLAKASASRLKMPYPETVYDDLYKLCVSIMLDNCDYVAAILPDSFITSELFQNRLYGVVSLTTAMFKNTTHPVCLAMFVPRKPNDDFIYYIGNTEIGRYKDLAKYSLKEYSNNAVQWRFNDRNGNIGVICCDNTIRNSIRFIDGSVIPNDSIKPSNRALTRISGLPDNINIETFLDKCNSILSEYRKNTYDIFLTSFKGLRKDGVYRRRIDFKTIKLIMNRAVDELHS